MKVTRRDSNVINNGRIFASTRNIDDNKQTTLANSSNKVKATHTRRRIAHERRSQIARINTALSNYFSVLRAIHLHSTQKLSFQSWLNESERCRVRCETFVVEFNFKCLRPDTGNPTVYSDGRLQIANLPPLVQRKVPIKPTRQSAPQRAESQ
jgi:hypothetical protein